MISISIEGIEDLLNLIQSLESRTITDSILDIVEDELWSFAQIIHSDNTIPDEYRNALSTKVIRELDTVVLMAIPSVERLKFIKFGTRLEWAAYRCPINESRILTINGFKLAKDITMEDKLIGIKKVSEPLFIMKEKYKGNISRIKLSYFKDILITDVHPILTYNVKRKYNYKDGKYQSTSYFITKQFKIAKEIKTSDYLLFPKYIGENNEIIIDKYKITKGLARLIGWYLAEGYPSGEKAKYQCGFCLGGKREDIIEVMELIRTELDLEPKIYTKDRQNTIVFFNSRKWNKIFTELSGRYAKNKHLPYNFLLWNNELLKELLSGYEKGDGYVHHRKDKITEVECSTVSEILASQLQIAYWKLGKFAGLNKHYRKEKMLNGRKLKPGFEYLVFYNINPRKKYVIELPEGYLIKVKENKLEKYEGEQIIIQTSDGHIQMPIVTHNCPKRKYYGGELSPQYSGPSYLKEKWNSYKNTFINNIKSRIIEMIRGR